MLVCIMVIRVDRAQLGGSHFRSFTKLWSDGSSVYRRLKAWLGWTSKMAHHMAGSRCLLLTGAHLGLSAGIPTSGLSMWFGFLTA